MDPSPRPRRWGDPLAGLVHGASTFSVLNVLVTWAERHFARPGSVGVVLLVLTLAAGGAAHALKRRAVERPHTTGRWLLIAGATLLGAVMGLGLGAVIVRLLGIGPAHVGAGLT